MDEVLQDSLTKEQLRKRIAELKSQGKTADTDKNEASEQPTFDTVQKLYSKVSKKLSSKDRQVTRKMQVRINRIDEALRELLAELD